jgi:5-hydroxyisourate hydrolase
METDMAGLTTHVLDLATGRPAAGLRVTLDRIDGDERRRLEEVVTNADGRCDGPLIAADDMRPGIYELTFHAGDYFDAVGVTLPDPKFLDEVPIRFGVADPAAHYHVPLLLSSFGFSTYRGS